MEASSPVSSSAIIFVGLTMCGSQAMVSVLMYVLLF